MIIEFQDFKNFNQYSVTVWNQKVTGDKIVTSICVAFLYRNQPKKVRMIMFDVIKHDSKITAQVQSMHAVEGPKDFGIHKI
jgi:hypothetical protein